MITRNLAARVRAALDQRPAAALLGPRQVGKTTLALGIARERDGLYLDLENPKDLAKLEDPVEYLSTHAERLVVIDEIHRAPGLMPVLRGIIDEGRRRSLGTGRFLLLGSASLDLLKQSGESLAGRIRYLELGPLNVGELEAAEHRLLWVRGGFPDSFLAPDDSASHEWREDLVRTYLERDVPQLGPRIPAETLRRFWTMLAHAQGSVHNAAKIGASIEVSGQSVSRYTDLLVDLLLVRRLQPYLANVGKRLVKSPKVYIRDSGLLHALLGIHDYDALLGHPVASGSWEGFAVENILASAPTATIPGFYRSSGGAEIDLVLELPGGGRWAIEVKRSVTTRPSRGFHSACQDLKPARKLLVHGGSEQFRMGGDVEAVGLAQLAQEVGCL